MRRYASWRATALALALLGACLPAATRVLAGPQGAIVHVRWDPSLDPAARQALEARFRLTDGQRLDADTWRYDLIDPSNDNIRALVNDAAVADTHDIDRPNYSLASSASRTARRQRFPAGGDLAVSVADGLALVLATLTGLLVALGVSGRSPRSAQLLAFRVILHVWNTARAAVAPVLRWLQRGIPDVDARTAGLFRIGFGLAVLVFFNAHAIDASRLGPSFDTQIEGELHASVMQWLRGNPFISDFLAPWLLTTGALFTAGIFTRLTYGLFVAGAIVWAFVAVSFDSTHPHSTLMLTLVALLPSAWGDAFSVDAWRRRTRTPRLRSGPERQSKGTHESAGRAAGTRYGYSVWAPGLVLGVAFAAAAWAKLSGPSGWTSWILNGTVKYHFITDSIDAPVDWGLQLAAHPWLAILASLGTVAIEALAVTAAFSRSELYRLSVGAGALSLLVGFQLFMGVLWVGWWIPLVGFLPWQRLSLVGRGFLVPPKPRSGEGGTPRQAGREGPPYGSGAMHATAAQLAVIAFVIAQQIVISTLAIERAPMFTHYPMYSYTFASAAEFDAWVPPVYRIVVSTDRGNVELRCHANEDLVTALHAALKGSAESAATVWRAVGACRGEDTSGARQVTFEEDWPIFDWTRLQFTIRRAAAVHGPLAAYAGPVAGC